MSKEFKATHLMPINVSQDSDGDYVISFPNPEYGVNGETCVGVAKEHIQILNLRTL